MGPRWLLMQIGSFNPANHILINPSAPVRAQGPGRTPDRVQRIRATESTPGQLSNKERRAGELSEEEKAKVAELKKVDRETRAHEQAHKTAGGQYVTGGPTYEYVVGPDGRQYAVSGEVTIDTSPVRDDPEATIQKMQQVRAAALAPANPSSQDRAVAADASAKEGQARAELMKQRVEEQREALEPGGNPELQRAYSESEGSSTGEFLQVFA